MRRGTGRGDGKAPAPGGLLRRQRPSGSTQSLCRQRGRSERPSGSRRSGQPCSRPTASARPLRPGTGTSRYSAVEASWRSGYAEDCKSLHGGSIPSEASIGSPRNQRIALHAGSHHPAWTADSPYAGLATVGRYSPSGVVDPRHVNCVRRRNRPVSRLFSRPTYAPPRAFAPRPSPRSSAERRGSIPPRRRSG